MKANAWHELAQAPRKSYLARIRRIRPDQERWVKAILDMWGSEMGGSTSPQQACGVIGRLMIVTDWDSSRGESIVKTVEALHDQGYRGTELFQKAKEIISPRNSFSNLFARANEGEEAVFVDKVILKTFSQNNPIRTVAIDYYCERKPMQDIAKYLQRVHAPYLTLKQCIDRVRWCRELFCAGIFHALSEEIREKIIFKAA